ncbi:Response regulator receiver domain-containing protein [Actinopolymorpha singaporensis]|uniref:Response regulator receiver domain-containing protein n=1 Tax=Actinopolymorpha singaporensis TaxID=117157 RepID=A0A1H1SX98_9ACTN|nr:Response regulator receiver domain-containing protein [Actinopolymorpha singaporensis]
MDATFVAKGAESGEMPCHHASVATAASLGAGAGVPTPLRVLLVDGQELLSRGLRLLLDQEHDIEVVGEAGDGRTAERVVAERLPDVVLLRRGHASRAVGEVCRRLKSLLPTTRIVLLTEGAELSASELAEVTGSAGADGQVPRDSPVDDVAAVIRAVANRAAA